MDGSNIIVIVSFLEHIVDAGDIVGIISAIIISSFFICFLPFCCVCCTPLVASRHSPKGENLHRSRCGLGSAPWGGGPAGWWGSTCPRVFGFLDPPPASRHSPGGGEPGGDVSLHNPRVMRCFEGHHRVYSPLRCTTFFIPTDSKFVYHIDSNTAVRNVSSSFTAVAHASAHDDAQVVAFE